MIGRAALVVAGLLTLALPAPPRAWTSATPGRAIVLPADHSSHPDYKLEWWYYTGNLDASDHRRFGYQLTFFRVGVDPAPVNPSRWAVRDLYMAHLALTDVNGQQYRFTDRMNRAGPGWAGASTDRYQVWNEDWRVDLDGSRHHLVAASREFGIDLHLDETRPPALNGLAGYSQKGAAAGNASYYYSLTRMPTRGTVVVNRQPIEVAGESWMDHEFGTNFLEAGQVGWDWFSIQLSDGRDLMIFELRRSDGSIDPHSSGTLVERDGRTHAIDVRSGFSLEPGRVWTSRVSGAHYPVTWIVRVPSAALDLEVTAALDNQELSTDRSTGVTYWEGATDVRSRSGATPLTGRGYLEMTGYAGPAMSAVMR